MELTFWGVRGGIPVPGPKTTGIGGDTVCLDITDSDCDGNATCRAVLDAGTGITHLGRSLLAGPAGKGSGDIHIFLTHTHWDHIQGFPYFIPAFIPGNRVTFWGRAVSDRSVSDLLEGQMRAEYNPIFALKNMGSTITVNEIGSSPVEFGPFTMKTILLPHKGTASLGFRISDGKRDVAFLGDLEYTDGSIPDDIVAFASGADLLIHDAGELDLASVDSHLALQLAERTGVKRLLFTHFAPWHTDKDVARLIAAVKKRAPSTLGVEAAHQGLRVTV